MYDNGLLKYFKDKAASKNGYLKLEELDIQKDEASSLKAKIDGQDYYVKKCIPSVLNGEVLLSQVYKTAGLKSSICLPAIYQNEMYAVSKNVREENCVTALEFFNHIKRQNAPTFKLIDGRAIREEKEFDYSKYYTPGSLRELILMQALDTGVFNTDRHMKNFFVQVEDDFEKMQAQHVVSFDYGVSARMAEASVRRPSFPKFYNTFGDEVYICADESRTRSGMVNAFRYNEVVNEYYPREELAEKISQIDVRAVADDISEQTGFELHKHYVDIVANSVDRLVEEIGQ